MLGQIIQRLLVDKATVVVSNVPGPLSPLVYCEGRLRSKSILAMIPGSGDLAFGISAISHFETLRMTVQSDEAYLKDPKAVALFIENNY